MAADSPLSRLALHAGSLADDLGYVALADLAHMLGGEAALPYRVIGGHMVTALVARWRLGPELYRETGDTDLGVPPVVVRDGGLVERLLDLGYERVAGNRFVRPIDDVPVRIVGASEAPRQAVIDVLVPAYRRRARHTRRIGGDLVTTEAPGLATALARPPVTLEMELHRLNGERLDILVAFPDEAAALTMKALATRVRTRDADVVDVWRCLEAAVAAGVPASAFADAVAAQSVATVRGLFESRHGPGMTALVGAQRLSATAADERFTRLRALIARVFEER